MSGKLTDEKVVDSLPVEYDYEEGSVLTIKESVFADADTVFLSLYDRKTQKYIGNTVLSMDNKEITLTKLKELLNEVSFSNDLKYVRLALILKKEGRYSSC